MPDVDRALTSGHTYSDEKVALQLVIPFRDGTRKTFDLQGRDVSHLRQQAREIYLRQAEEHPGQVVGCPARPYINIKFWFNFKEIPVDLNEPMTPVDETEAKDGLD